MGATLVTKVKATVPDEMLKQLTNYNTTPSAIDETRLLSMTDEVEGIFFGEFGKIYRFTGITDEEALLHDYLCVHGVQLLLQYRKNMASELLAEQYDNWIDQLRRMRDRTFSQVTPDAGDNLIRENQADDDDLALEARDEFGLSNQRDRLPGLGVSPGNPLTDRV